MVSITKNLILASCLVSITCVASSNDLTYWVKTTKANPTVANLSVNTSKLGKFVLEQPRAMSASANKAPLNITCVSSQKHESAIQFGQPVTCKSIQWTVQFKKLVGDQYDASSQQNIYSPSGWWLLVEWGNLPRFADNNSAVICATGSKKFCSKLPGKNAAPLFFVWGKKTSTITTNNLHLQLFSNKGLLSSEVPQISLQLEKQLVYLSKVFPHNQQQIDWSLIWVAIDQKYKSLGGAAGANAYITNYLVNEGKLTDKTIPLLLRVSAHETIHGISNFKLPLWINESLAEYYAFKALKHTGVNTREPLKDWQQQGDRLPHPEAGLYEAHDRVVKHQDMSYYPLFYVKGSAFWQELDAALQNKGKDLDQYVALLDTTDNKSSSLNRTFIDAMIKSIGSKHWATISNQYLK